MDFSDARIEKIVATIRQLKAEQLKIPILENRIKELEDALALQKNMGNPEKIVKIAALFTPAERKEILRELTEMIRDLDLGISYLELQLSDLNP